MAHAPAGPARGLPLRAGLGLKPAHFKDILNSRPDVGFFEVHAENYMVPGGPMHHYLTRIRERYALSIHGVGLSIGAATAPDEDHLDRLAELVARYEPEQFSEHLAWSTHDGRFLNDLLPIAYTAATLARVCTHIQRVQERLKRQVLIENPATYVEFAASTMDEAQFLSDVVDRSGCGLLLDVNNAYVSCVNHHRDTRQYLSRLPLYAAGEIHLAGFSAASDDAGSVLLIDDHGSAVAGQVWDLYAFALRHTGALPTLIERDNDIPSLGELLAEARSAETILAEAKGLGQAAALASP